MIWGTLIQRKGGASDDSDEYIDNFFQTTHEDPSWEMNQVQDQVNAFVASHMENDQRRGIALVTSGATIVPLDPTQTSFVDQSPQVQEFQGPACAEYLLHLGYSVIFVHREDSLQPFSRHFQKYIKNGAFMDMLNMKHEDVVMDGLDATQKARFEQWMQLYKHTKGRLLNIKFTMVQQYLRILKVTTQAIHVARTRAIVILAASVNDYYVPLRSLQDSPQKNDEFSVNFVRVPNLIGRIRKTWCPQAFLVTFKHRLASNVMVEKAHGDLEKWGVDVVVGTNRLEYPDQILLVSESEDTILSCPEDEDINDAFASSIAKLHALFRRKRNVLKKGKQLLLLSAKFSMLKERDCVNIDADGNKNVKFGLGVKICADRRVQHGPPPTYELKHIFQNKSKCARGHIWESQLIQEDNGSNLDVVVAFSPAGNPETIKTMWGDFWSGWAESELVEVKNEVMGMSLSSAMNVAASTISGDYTPASNLIQYMWGKVGTAWSDGEQTRIRQSLQNMISVAMNRGLVEADDITPLDALMGRPRTQRLDSLVVDPAPSSVHSHSRHVRRHSDEMNEHLSLSKARHVRVHQTIKSYLDDMMKQGLLDAIMNYVRQGAAVHVTGYSMGGQLGQLLMLYVGDRARMEGLDTSKINFVGFGSPRVGDIGLAARLKILFDAEQLVIVMHPSDTVHAFPSTAEGYVDTALKIFLKQDGLGVGRRTASSFSLLPLTKSIDSIFERGYQKYAAATNGQCKFCQSKTHSTEQHRCRYCTERGSHRGVDCVKQGKPCALCGHENHCTGEHRCRVCSQYGHRGRECHAQRDVGLTEIVTYFRYHHFVYYNANLKQSVEFVDD